MPTVRKLTDEEVEQLTRGRGPVDLTLYATAGRTIISAKLYANLSVTSLP